MVVERVWLSDAARLTRAALIRTDPSFGTVRKSRDMLRESLLLEFDASLARSPGSMHREHLRQKRYRHGDHHSKRLQDVLMHSKAC